MAESLRALVEAVRAARADYAMRRGGGIANVHAASRALADHLLTHPEAVEAVEVLRAWGEARANLRRVNDETWDQGRAGYLARRDAERAEGDPRRAVEELADRLAAVTVAVALCVPAVGPLVMDWWMRRKER